MNQHRTTPEPSKWARIIQADPEHTNRYIQRFKVMEEQGHDLYGEARFVDAMVGRNAHILDAGCGPGRLDGWLHERGHRVVGVDLDPGLIAAAEIDHPGPTYFVGDLAELDLPARGVEDPFDVIVCAGNVMGFLAESTRGEVLRRLANHLADDGRLAIGFGAGRGYGFDEFIGDATAAGLQLELALSTWDLRPYRDGDGFLVAVFARA
ncbi:class I SAM-dependent methyltransferase [Aestuariimicrobium sp. Y1814]|uniref:class I SAM-dependent methyltransferase n=1 Tax=Aestuariimicrobium sp. Y1814 TaxID=3418742 RepID=UPI003DA70906